jgi:hypothetical protein
MLGMRVERPDHPGIVVGIRREIGLAENLDALAGRRTVTRDWLL